MAQARALSLSYFVSIGRWVKSQSTWWTSLREPLRMLYTKYIHTHIRAHMHTHMTRFKIFAEFTQIDILGQGKYNVQYNSILYWYFFRRSIWHQEIIHITAMRQPYNWKKKQILSQKHPNSLSEKFHKS